MQLQKLFPCWRALAEQARIPWTRDFDLSRPQDLWAVLAITCGGQDAAVGTPSYFELAEAMVADAMALAEAAPPGPAQVALQYLQFTIALGPLKNAMAVGDFGLAHDWIHHGLGDSTELTIQRPVHIGRIHDFALSGHPVIRATNGQVLADWAMDFYYYARLRGILGVAAAALLPILLHALRSLPPDEDTATDAYSMMLNWAADNGHRAATTLTARLRRTFNRSQDVRVRTRLAAVFASTAGGLSGELPAYWAQWALDHGEVHLVAHQRLQLLWQLIATVEDWERLKPRVLNEVGAYAAEIATLADSDLIAKHVLTSQTWLCASPDYLAVRGTPLRATDLHAHTLLDYADRPVAYHDGAAGPAGIAEFCPHAVISDAAAILPAVLGGCGIARLPDFLVKAPVEEGRLVRLWPAGRTHEVAIHALYPSHRALSAKVRVFIDALAEAAKSHADR